MNNSSELVKYKQKLRRHIKDVAPIFAQASIGDFSKDVPIPEDDDDLTVFLVGVQIILDAIREKIDESESQLTRLNALNAELEHDKATYHAILSSMAEGLLAVNKEGRITLVNKAAADMLKLNPRTTTGVNYYDVVVTRDRNGQTVPIKQRPLQRAISSGRQKITGLGNGLQYVRSDGSTIPVAITAAPVKIGKEVIGAVSTFRDISEEMQIDRTKSEIISIASHQLRTPLTAIKWISEQLIAPVAKISRLAQRKKLQQIHASNERMISLVNDLLNVSRIDLGTLSLEVRTFNLQQMVDDILHDLESQIGSHHLQVTKHIDSKLKEINTDPRHIQVILQNLLSNAVKYSPNKKHITITCHLKNNQLELAVTDNGCGIPASQQDKIFSKLFRADNARQLASEGSGLGLYVTKAMVGQLGGKISFESVENKGSTFYVTIPLGQTEPSS